MTRIASRRWIVAALIASGNAACSGSDGGFIDDGPTDLGGAGGAAGASSPVGGRTSGGAGPTNGGTNSSGGANSSSSGGALNVGGINQGQPSGGSTVNAGGNTTSGASGTSKAGNGGTPTGGTGKGGATNGGAATGGAGKGGATTNGGAGKGGATNGGAATGGAATGGAATGGTGKGGTSTGGAATGGAGKGGTSTGGAATGGAAGACTAVFADPPPDVAAWVQESWGSQLGDNITSRKAWLLDSAMLGKGQINLCVRWGATTAPSAAVKTGMAAAVQKWFNDWFSQLQGYGCFPYPTITAKVTGWAVRPGNTSWVSDLGSDVKIYTETDGEGEPKCADSCSFFTNWTHNFPNCPGGEAFHHDYWLWLDDSIGGGAAAVGGDWGLRMPVSNFVNSMGKSNLVIEHEMGHGFGFQDYYTWNGARPTGGSLMIVGSTSSQSPTNGDSWLLRRAWKETKTLRGW